MTEREYIVVSSLAKLRGAIYALGEAFAYWTPNDPGTPLNGVKRAEVFTVLGECEEWLEAEVRRCRS